jgi:nitrogen fixation protein NifU and related proteins
MADLRELYQQTILDHNRSPRNYRKLDHPTKTSEGLNPLCGDHITVYLQLENGVIRDIGFQGTGCAISKASASIMSSLLKGKTAAEAEALFHKFHALVTEESGVPEDLDSLGKLAVFAGVREFPARVKCASLAWHTMHTALHEEDKKVTTE